MNAVARRLWKADRAAVAPLVALSLFALIGVGGIAFDYARLASMDTELQQAADQAALSAASQLDGEADARMRATAAARNLITNMTLFANDTLGTAIAVPTIIFYSDRSKTKVSTSDGDANFVEVEVATRRANYALTPVVGAFFGDARARAFAGVDGALCGVVPFFICNPVEPAGNTDLGSAVGGVGPGTGIVMAEGGTQWGPGNFGFLDQVGNGANGVAEALASNSLLGNCSGTRQITTKPGNILNAVRDSLNMRFDFKPGNNSACQKPPCSPSTNVRKDVVRGSNCDWVQNPATSANYQEKRYRPTSNAPLDPTLPAPEIMGHPRDICHSRGGAPYPDCPFGRVGDGVWDREAYFRSNHPSVDWRNTARLGSSVSRYLTYLWEAEDPAARLASKASAGNSLTAHSTPQAGKCLAPGAAPDPAGIDRRRITAAVVNCGAANRLGLLNGKKTIPVAGFIDVFLVEPSLARTTFDGGTAITSINDIYVESISASGREEGGSVGQITRRDVPRLIE